MSLVHQTSTFTARLIRLAAQISPSAHKGSNNFWTGGRQPLPNRVTSELLVIRPESMPSAEITSCKPTFWTIKRAATLSGAPNGSFPDGLIRQLVQLTLRAHNHTQSPSLSCTHICPSHFIIAPPL